MEREKNGNYQTRLFLIHKHTECIYTLSIVDWMRLNHFYFWHYYKLGHTAIIFFALTIFAGMIFDYFIESYCIFDVAILINSNPFYVRFIFCFCEGWELKHFFMKFSSSRQMERITSIHSWSHQTVTQYYSFYINFDEMYKLALSLPLTHSLACPDVPFAISTFQCLHVRIHQRIRTTRNKLLAKQFWLRLFLLLFFQFLLR